METRNLGISLNQGDDFNLVIAINGDSGPLDITGYRFLGEMKASTAPTAPVVAEFVFSILDQITHKGQVSWSLPNTVTAALITSVSDPEQRERRTTPFVFDVKMKDTSAKISRIIQGIIYVSPEVTQEAFP